MSSPKLRNFTPKKVWAVAQRARKELSLTEHAEAAEVKASLGLFIIEKGNALFFVCPVGFSAAGER